MTTMVKEKLDKKFEDCIRFANVGATKDPLRETTAKSHFDGYIRAFKELGFITPEEEVEYWVELLTILE